MVVRCAAITTHAAESVLTTRPLRTVLAGCLAGCTLGVSQGSGSRPLVAPAASGYAYGSHWRSAVAAARAKVDRHVVVYDASFRRSEGEQCFYGAIKDNYGAAKLLDASDRAWLGKPAPPPARVMWRSLFPAAAKVEVDNAWICEL